MRGFNANVRLIAIGTMLCIAGSGVFYILPVYLEAVGTHLHVSDAQLGALSGVESAAIAVASFLSSFWINRRRRTVLVAACIVSFMGNVLIAVIASYPQLLALRAITGLFGEGPLYALSFAILGSTRSADRAFSIGITLTVAFTSLTLAIAGLLEHIAGLAGILGPLTLVAVGIAACYRWIPEGSFATLRADINVAKARRTPNPNIVMAALGLWYGAPGAFWAFAAAVGIRNGLPAGSIGVALSVGVTLGLIGSIIPAIARGRWGYKGPILCASVGLSIMAPMLLVSINLTLYIATITLFNVFWNLASVFQLSLISAEDPTGTSSALAPGATVAGIAVGSWLGGIALTNYGYASISVLVPAFCCAGVGAFALQLHRRRLATPTF